MAKKEHRLYRSELELLRWIGTKADGVTVDQTAKKFSTTRQSAYVRLERALAKRFLRYKTEACDGPQPRSRYSLAARGRKEAGRAWRELNERVMVAT